MKKSLALFFCLLPVTASAAPLAPGDAARLEGEWRNNAAPSSDACGRNGEFLYGVNLTMEFRLTGGQIAFDDGSEGAGPQRVTASEKSGSEIVLRLENDDQPLRLRPVGKDGLTVAASSAPGLVGKTFRQCRSGAPRDGIALSRTDMTFLATTMLPQNPRFVDARSKGGCKASQYQYLNFDLANPVAPEIRRENSDALGAAIFAKRKVTAPRDEDGMGRWVIEGAGKTATGYEFRVTELIPPNGSRGDTTRLAVQRTAAGIAIPAWKRAYLRCPQ